MNMRKRVQIALTVLPVAIFGVIVWQVLRPREREREPVYQGKGLRVWLSENYYAWARRDGQAQDLAESAIRRIGTNAIPALLNMLRKKDSSLVSILSPSGTGTLRESVTSRKVFGSPRWTSSSRRSRGPQANRLRCCRQSRREVSTASAAELAV